MHIKRVLALIMTLLPLVARSVRVPSMLALRNWTLPSSMVHPFGFGSPQPISHHPEQQRFFKVNPLQKPPEENEGRTEPVQATQDQETGTQDIRGQETNDAKSGSVTNSATTVVELPGLNQDDIIIELFDDHLKISATRSSRQVKSDEGYHFESSSYGYYEKTIPVPPGLDQNDIKATLDEQGVLKVEYPDLWKMASEKEPEVRKIEVQKE